MQNFLFPFQTIRDRFVHTHHYFWNNNKPPETYYTILQLNKDCSQKEVRSAFVRLSKKFHPDVKGVLKDPNQTAQFVKISEAYQILSKPRLRTAYDQDLWARSVINGTGCNGLQKTETYRPWEIKPNYDPNPGPYYGVKGLKRVSNSKIALSLIALGVFGAAFGFLSVKHSFALHSDNLDQKSSEASSHHANIRAEAKKFGNEEQIRRMLDRMMKEER